MDYEKRALEAEAHLNRIAGVLGMVPINDTVTGQPVMWSDKEGDAIHLDLLVDDELKKLRRLDVEYGQVEEAIIMADPQFDGDSDHATCGERLIASIDRLKSKRDFHVGPELLNRIMTIRQNSGNSEEAARDIAQAVITEARASQGENLIPWDMHAEFTLSAKKARQHLDHVMGSPKRGHTYRVGEPGSIRAMTVGKHEANNAEHLRQIYAEAFDTNPRFADTLAWLLWHRIKDADRLAFLSGPDYIAAASERKAGADPELLRRSTTLLDRDQLVDLTTELSQALYIEQCSHEATKAERDELAKAEERRDVRLVSAIIETLSDRRAEINAAISRERKQTNDPMHGYMQTLANQEFIAWLRTSNPKSLLDEAIKEGWFGQAKVMEEDRQRQAQIGNLDLAWLDNELKEHGFDAEGPMRAAVRAAISLNGDPAAASTDAPEQGKCETDNQSLES